MVRRGQNLRINGIYQMKIDNVLIGTQIICLDYDSISVQEG